MYMYCSVSATLPASTAVVLFAQIEQAVCTIAHPAHADLNADLYFAHAKEIAS